MSTPRQRLYDRLPEIYRIRDNDQEPKGQLKAYLVVLESILSGIRDNIEALYHDFFIETCEDWAIPYIADLLGTSHLSGDPWTLRADVARTIYHRRRKGTRRSIESVTYTLSGWVVHTVEMRDRLVWNQHLNHQREDEGGEPPLRKRMNIRDAVRGGTVSLRDPALLSLLSQPKRHPSMFNHPDGAFDPFAHVVDLKPLDNGLARFNLPNLAIYLWRLEDYRVPVSKPRFVNIQKFTSPEDGKEIHCVRYSMHPLGEPMVLFNRHQFHDEDDRERMNIKRRFQIDRTTRILLNPDRAPGPIPMARLNEAENTPAGRPENYVQVKLYDDDEQPKKPGSNDVGLILHVPKEPFSKTKWKFRGANLCAWEKGLRPALGKEEIVIDPELGRMVIGVVDRTKEANPLRDNLLISATYGFSGPTGAHPISRDSVQNPIIIDTHDTTGRTLQEVLGNIQNEAIPTVIEIRDSMNHEINIPQAIRLKGPLWIRAGSGERPLVILGNPLKFRPASLSGPNETKIDELDVTLEGLYITRAPAYTGALIEQAAVNSLVLEGCTMDPGGATYLDGTSAGSRLPTHPSVQLNRRYGFTSVVEEKKFNEAKQIPEIILRKTISGPLRVDDNYTLKVTGSIIDAGSGLDDPKPELAVSSATGDPEKEWGPPLEIFEKIDETETRPGKKLYGMTCFGRMRVFSATGEGGIWTQRLEVHDNQKGCIKFSYFSGKNDRLPPHHGCVFGEELRFVSTVFGQPGYAQLRLTSDRRIIEQGPGNDAMGAFGYLQNTHKWKNIRIRYREFIPVGTRPVLIPMT